MTVALTDRALLEAWSGSRDWPAHGCADALLARALAVDDPEGWPLPRRHAALAELRIGRWGSLLEAVAACPACATQVEIEFDLAAVEQPPSAERASVTAAGGELCFRVPTRADLQAAADASDPRRTLVERCVEGPARGLPDAAIDAVAAAMELADPLGALRLELTCPGCDRRWAEPLDLAGYLATEARDDARAIAAEVHELALAYGWSEAEVLALPAERRRLYLELVAG